MIMRVGRIWKVCVVRTALMARRLGIAVVTLRRWVRPGFMVRGLRNREIIYR